MCEGKSDYQRYEHGYKPRVLCSTLGFPGQEGQGPVGASPEKGFTPAPCGN